MTAGLGLVTLTIAAATAAFVLIIREVHLRALDTRVSNSMMGIPGRSTPSQDMIGWFSSIGMRYRRFYAAEDLEQLRTILQSAGFNHYRTLPLWIGVKIVGMFLCPVVALLVAQLFGRAPTDVLFFTLIGGAIGIVAPRLILSVLKRRFDAAIRLGT